MLVLAIDTATPAVTVGLVDLAGGARGRTLAERVGVDPRAHAELLMPQAVQVLREAGVTLAELHAVAVGVGPGPFTGLRVGMVTAAALGHAAECPVYPVGTLDAIASAVAPRLAEPSPFLVATDARRKEIYWAVYDAAGSRIGGPAVSRPEELAGELAGLGVSTAAGHGARRYAEVLGLPLTELDYPSPRGLVAVAAEQIRTGAAPDPLTPLYLRRPDAELPAARKRVLR